MRELVSAEIEAVSGGPFGLLLILELFEKANDRHAIENASDVCGEQGVSSVTTAGDGATITCK